jgi:Laminin B (Domain IV)
MIAIGVLAASALLLPPSASAVVRSDFESGDDDGWIVIGNQSITLQFDPAGGNPGGRVTVEDDGPGAVFFSAPAKFRGDQSEMYEGFLAFDLFSNTTQADTDGPDVVELVGAGLTLTFSIDRLPGMTWVSHTISLVAADGWSDPQGPASEGQLQAVLENLEAIHIPADWLSGTGPEDQTSLDNVTLIPGRTTVFGLKSCAFTDPACSAGTEVSQAPTHLFSFRDDGMNFLDRGQVTAGGIGFDADGLAMNSEGILYAFDVNPALGSRLVHIDAATAVATVVGPFLPGKELRGAAFDSRERLRVLDNSAGQLLEIDPSTGLVVGPPITISDGFSPLALQKQTDLAFDSAGQGYLVIRDRFYSLDPSSGVAVLLFTETEPEAGPGDVGPYYAGLAFSRYGPTTALTYETRGFDDIYAYSDPFNQGRTNVVPDLISSFNSGLGDLASYIPAAEPVPLLSPTVIVLVAGLLAVIGAHSQDSK